MAVGTGRDLRGPAGEHVGHDEQRDHGHAGDQAAQQPVAPRREARGVEMRPPWTTPL